MVNTQPLSKGSAKDISMGPVSKRSCTDVLFFLLFASFMICYLAVCALSFQQGDPQRYGNS